MIYNLLHVWMCVLLLSMICIDVGQGINQGSFNRTRYEGDKFRLECRISKRKPKVWKWFFEGKELVPYKPYRMKWKALRIRNVTVANIGQYICLHSDGKIEKSLTFNLRVFGPNSPLIDDTKDPPFIYWHGFKHTLRTVLKHDTYWNGIDCESNGTRPLNITWFKDGQKLPLEESPKGFEYVKRRQFLKLNNATEYDVGNYSCIVKNKYGQMSHYIRIVFTHHEDNLMKVVFPDRNEIKLTADPYTTVNLSEKIYPFEPGTLVFTHDNQTKLSHAITKKLFLARVIAMYLNVNITVGSLSSGWANVTIRAKPLQYSKDSVVIYIKKRPEVKPLDKDNDKSFLYFVFGLVSFFAIFIVGFLMRIFRERLGLSCFKSKGEDLQVTLNLKDIQNSQWNIPFDNLDIEDVIGEGAFGHVVRAKAYGIPKFPGLVVVAVKMMKAEVQEEHKSSLVMEIEVMKAIGTHPNIVNILATSIREALPCLIMEYCCYGNLRDFLKDRRQLTAGLSPDDLLKQLISFCIQTAHGLQYLSEKKCVHRDVAARNVLVADKYVAKIADFGLSRNLEMTKDYYRKITDGLLPIKWMSFEALFDRVFTSQGDVWSYGILLWEIVTMGGTPYPGITPQMLFHLLAEKYRMEKPTSCTQELYDLMMLCWRQDPNERPCFKEIVNTLGQMGASCSSGDLDTDYWNLAADHIEQLA